MSVDEAERRARLALSCVVEAGDLEIGGRVSREGAEQVWSQLREGSTDSRWNRRAALFDPEPVLELAEQARVRFVVPGDREWPEPLADLATASPVQNQGGVPIGLWLRGGGNLVEISRRSVAIVGSRAASPYGVEVAAHLAAELQDDRWRVISGGAYGIDAAAHRGALAMDAPTVAVLACGPDQPYPTGNQGLFNQILDHGVLVSEQPPGERPTKPRFLIRNRLIAALSTGVVVVEGALRSGSRSTATWATRCGRPLMAVPGSVLTSESVTPHALIRDQEAVLVTGAAHVREVVGSYGDDCLPHERSPDRPLDRLSTHELMVYEALPARGARTADELSIRAGLPVTQCLTALATLQVSGLVAQTADGRWCLG
ncbi:DNA-processing protein DprA [Enemella sp. A6]|uniref:DNA-processing protein DprA n=1 Tax=Enemella sp. A6 TaxID=3440152 RepID=UPI003EC10DAB